LLFKLNYDTMNHCEQTERKHAADEKEAAE